jgi:hypothetical protein
MSVSCKNCHTNNIDGSHYCAKCGKALETTWDGREKKYVIVSQSEYDALKAEKSSLTRQVTALQRRVLDLQAPWYEKLGGGVGRMFKGIWSWISEWFWLLFTPLLLISLFLIGRCSGNDEPQLKIVQDKETAKYGLYNEKTDEYVIDCEYNNIELRKGKDYHFYYIYKEKTGIADRNGQITVPCGLDSAKSIGAVPLIRTFSSRKQGLVDYYGNVILPCKYDQVLAEESNIKKLDYVGDVLPVKEAGKKDWTLLDREGKQITSTKYKYVRYVKEHPDLISVGQNSVLMGIMNMKEELLIPCRFFQFGEISDNRIWARELFIWWLYAPDGTSYGSLKEEFDLPEPYAFSEGLMPIIRKEDKKIGYVDTLFKVTIPFDYEQVPDVSPAFRKGKATVSYNGQIGTIDKDGKFKAK